MATVADDPPSAVKRSAPGGGGAGTTEATVPAPVFEPSSPTPAPALTWLATVAPVLLLILVNVCASTLLVAVNKYLVLSYGFRHVLLLSGLHFFVGWVLMAALSSPSTPSMRLFERKVVPLMAALPAAVTGMGSIVLMNYSLRTNSLGSYQMIKVAVLPATIILAALQGVRVGAVDVATAVLVSLGTAVSTVTDVDLTLAGTAVGLAAVVATAQYQVAQGAIQTQAELSSPQAMLAISPPQALLSLAASMLLETAWAERLGYANGGARAASPAELARLRAAGALRTVGSGGGAWDASGAVSVAARAPTDDVWRHPYTLLEIGLILVTCACAAALNYSGIALIGKINPIAFQFVNQTKTVIIVAVGFLVFAEAADATRVASVAFGLFCVISGIGWYTYHKQTAKKASGK